MINTAWYHLDLEEIERIERKLKKERFRAESSLSISGDFLGWLVHKTLYSSDEELITVYRYKRTIFGHSIGTYRYGDVTFRIREKTYTKLL